MFLGYISQKHKVNQCMPKVAKSGSTIGLPYTSGKTGAINFIRKFKCLERL